MYIAHKNVFMVNKRDLLKILYYLLKGTIMKYHLFLHLIYVEKILMTYNCHHGAMRDVVALPSVMSPYVGWMDFSISHPAMLDAPTHPQTINSK